MRASPRFLLSLLLACTAALPACGGSSEPKASDDPERQPVAAEVVRARWTALVPAENELRMGVAALGGMDAESKMRRLQLLRGDAGMLHASLGRIVPKSDLAACHQEGREGAAQLRDALGAINEFWMGRSPPEGTRREQAGALASNLCSSFARLRRAREACGVTAERMAPNGCPEG